MPSELLRPDVLLLAGEDPAECLAAVGGAWSHSYRGFHAQVQGDLLILVTPFGSSAMEAILWELLPHARRVIMGGTAGSLGGFSGPAGRPLAVTSATPCYQAFDAPPISYTPSWPLDLTETASISTDRFYGFSPLIEGDYPAEPGLQEAWQRLGKTDAIVEMEVAAFFHYCDRFGVINLQYAAVKVVANTVEDLDSLPAGSADAMEAVIAAARAAF